jgi:hypothetical protein
LGSGQGRLVWGSVRVRARMAPGVGGLGSLDSGLELDLDLDLEQDLYWGRAWTLSLLSWFERERERERD